MVRWAGEILLIFLEGEDSHDFSTLVDVESL